MKSETKRMLGILTIVAAGALTMTGCGRRNEPVTTEPARAIEENRAAAGRAMERRGEELERAGEAMQDDGERLQQ